MHVLLFQCGPHLCDVRYMHVYELGLPPHDPHVLIKCSAYPTHELSHALLPNRRYVYNPVRFYVQNVNPMQRLLSKHTQMAVDAFHFPGHVDKYRREHMDPKRDPQIAAINTIVRMSSDCLVLHVWRRVFPFMRPKDATLRVPILSFCIHICFALFRYARRSSPG